MPQCCSFLGRNVLVQVMVTTVSQHDYGYVTIETALSDQDISGRQNTEIGCRANLYIYSYR